MTPEEKARQHIDVANSSKKTTNLASINLTQLRAFPVPLPPRNEQVRLIAEVERRLSLVESLEAELSENMLRVERLRQSILKQAFSERLVPQDPNDELASALLERIQSGYGMNGSSKDIPGDGQAQECSFQ
jgi:type I restriction enzyme S subunit